MVPYSLNGKHPSIKKFCEDPNIFKVALWNITITQSIFSLFGKNRKEKLINYWKYLFLYEEMIHYGGVKFLTKWVSPAK